MKVGVRELKAHLSQYLERAHSGDVIEVTERGRPKAVLGPVPGAQPAKARPQPVTPEVEAQVRESIARGVDEGWITPGNGEPPLSRRRRAESSMTVQALLDEDRGE